MPRPDLAELEASPELETLGLPVKLHQRLAEGGIDRVGKLYVFTPENFRSVYSLTVGHEERINAALVAHGHVPIEWPTRLEKPASGGRKKKQATPCLEDGCDEPRYKPYRRCGWHWLALQPIDVQIKAARSRRRKKETQDGFVYVSRMPEREWPEGRRWCSGCQSFVPLHYTRGARCKACASKAAHASHVQRTYGLAPEEYDQLLAWQGGRCYVCGQVPRARRLAVDHDHETGAVRGLLCANDEWGCNTSLRRLLGDLGAAQRLLAYVQTSPITRMRAGEAPPAYDKAPTAS